MRHFIILLIVLWGTMAHAHDTPLDSVADSLDWKQELRHLRIHIDDTTGLYPKGIQAVFNSIKWVRKALYTYDTTYVHSFDNIWRFTVKNNNWFDTYAGHISDPSINQNALIAMTSNITSKFGGHISYRGFGLGYMLNLRDVLQGRRLNNRRWDGSINTSRIAIEWYFTKDRSEINIHRLGDFGKGKWRSYRYDGLSREAYGVYGYYFFNHSRYCQAAGYGISRIQLRSAGSFIVGLNASQQDVTMDFRNISDEMKAYLPSGGPEQYRYRYRDYNFLLGYGYNWVPHRRWLVNVTAIPSVGWRKSLPNSTDGEKTMLSTNYRIKLAAVLNRKSWFYGINIVSDGHWYRNSNSSFFNSSQDINFAVGFRL